MPQLPSLSKRLFPCFLAARTSRGPPSLLSWWCGCTACVRDAVSLVVATVSRHVRTCCELRPVVDRDPTSISPSLHRYDKRFDRDLGLAAGRSPFQTAVHPGTRSVSNRTVPGTEGGQTGGRSVSFPGTCGTQRSYNTQLGWISIHPTDPKRLEGRSRDTMVLEAAFVWRADGKRAVRRVRTAALRRQAVPRGVVRPPDLADGALGSPRASDPRRRTARRMPVQALPPRREASCSSNVPSLHSSTDLCTNTERSVRLLGREQRMRHPFAASIRTDSPSIRWR